MNRIVWGFIYWVGLGPILFTVFLRLFSLPQLALSMLRGEVDHLPAWLTLVEGMLLVVALVFAAAAVWWVWRRAADSMTESGVLKPRRSGRGTDAA